MAQLQAQRSPLADFLWARTHVKNAATPPTVRVFVRTAHDEAYEATRTRILALAPPATQVVDREPPFPGISSDIDLSNAAAAPLDGCTRVVASRPDGRRAAVQWR
jgi:hypothetical protein